MGPATLFLFRHFYFRISHGANWGVGRWAHDIIAFLFARLLVYSHRNEINENVIWVVWTCVHLAAVVVMLERADFCCVFFFYMFIATRSMNFNSYETLGPIGVSFRFFSWFLLSRKITYRLLSCNKRDMRKWRRPMREKVNIVDGIIANHSFSRSLSRFVVSDSARCACCATVNNM